MIGSAVAGAVGAVALGGPGIGYPITAVAVLAVVVLARPRLTPWTIVGGIAALALSSVAVFRAADWLVSVSVWSAVLVAAVVLAGSRSWTGLLLAAVAPVLLPPRVFRWFTLGVPRPGVRAARPGRAMATAGVTVIVVTVFGALFAGADPAFGRLLDAATPQWDIPSAAGRAVVFVLVAGGAAAAAYLAVVTPRFDRLARPSLNSVHLWEWMIPVGTLVGLFTAFVGVQIATLFGGQRHVTVTAGLTNAEYARQGFWQLLAVTALTLVVIAVTVRKAPRSTTQERALLRTLLGILCVLALVVVASALHRMSLYEKQYGFTTLRLVVTAVELLLGSVLVLIAAAGVRMSGRWLPRAVGVCAVATLLGLAVLNPDAYIARHNVERFAQTGKIDTTYLAGLSADAIPELERLPEPYRSCVLARHAVRIDTDWRDWNRPDASLPAAVSTTSASRCAYLP